MIDGKMKRILRDMEAKGETKQTMTYMMLR